MSGFLLDTNIVSEALRPQPNEGIAVWLSHQRSEDLFLSAISVGELRKGILLLEPGKRRRQLEAWLPDLQKQMSGRILPFDGTCALLWGEMMAEGQRIGRSRPVADTMIAATAAVHGLIVVTRNSRDFTGIVEAYNPAS